MQTPRTRKQAARNPNLTATILKDGGSSCDARITRLWYDGCEMVSDDRFDVGQKVKVVIRGLGSIDANVINTSDGTVSVHFDEECPVEQSRSGNDRFAWKADIGGT